LIKTINEKDEILECQEDLLVKENKKFVKLKDAFALEVEKCKNLTKELNTCNDSISCLKTKNVSLIAKIEELNACHVPTSTIYVTPGFRRQTECEPCTCQDQLFTYTAVT
jgi:chromosome segregation ATPase